MVSPTQVGIVVLVAEKRPKKSLGMYALDFVDVQEMFFGAYVGFVSCVPLLTCVSRLVVTSFRTQLLAF